MKRENASGWDSGLEKEQILETYAAQLQKSSNSTKVIFGINDNYWAEEVPEGAHTLGMRVGGVPLPRGPPGSSPVPIFCYMKSFTLEKIISKLTGRNSAATRQNQSRAPAELFYRGNFPSGGGNHHHRHHQRSSHREGVNLRRHLHQQHLLSNPSSSLVSNLCTKTSDWYLWIGVLITPCSWC